MACGYAMQDFRGHQYFLEWIAVGIGKAMSRCNSPTRRRRLTRAQHGWAGLHLSSSRIFGRSTTIRQFDCLLVRRQIVLRRVALIPRLLERSRARARRTGAAMYVQLLRATHRSFRRSVWMASFVYRFSDGDILRGVSNS
jgi:hypothetical protein